MARPRHTVQRAVANQLVLRHCIWWQIFKLVFLNSFCATVISKFRDKVWERIRISGISGCVGGLVYCDVSRERVGGLVYCDVSREHVGGLVYCDVSRERVASSSRLESKEGDFLDSWKSLQPSATINLKTRRRIPPDLFHIFLSRIRLFWLQFITVTAVSTERRQAPQCGAVFVGRIQTSYSIGAFEVNRRNRLTCRGSCNSSALYCVHFKQWRTCQSFSFEREKMKYFKSHWCLCVPLVVT